MQELFLNELVNQMPNENFSIPIPVREGIRPLLARIGIKNKWKAFTAAVLAFHRMSDEEQNVAIEQVEAARRRNDFTNLLIRDVARTEAEPTPPQTSANPEKSGSPKRGRPGRPAARVGRSH